MAHGQQARKQTHQAMHIKHSFINMTKTRKQTHQAMHIKHSFINMANTRRRRTGEND
jgi:hypothetical protein